MDVWVSGGLALVGALAGVFLSTFLTRATLRKESRRARIEEAFRRTSTALAAANFATHVGATNRPSGVSEKDIRDLEVRLFIGNLENYYAALHDARRAVAMLAADRLDVGDSWRTAERFQDDLESLYSRLEELLRST